MINPNTADSFKVILPFFPFVLSGDFHPIYETFLKFRVVYPTHPVFGLFYPDFLPLIGREVGNLSIGETEGRTRNLRLAKPLRCHCAISPNPGLIQRPGTLRVTCSSPSFCLAVFPSPESAFAAALRITSFQALLHWSKQVTILHPRLTNRALPIKLLPLGWGGKNQTPHNATRFPSRETLVFVTHFRPPQVFMNFPAKPFSLSSSIDGKLPGLDEANQFVCTRHKPRNALTMARSQWLFLAIQP